MSKRIQRERIFATLCGGFGALALILSVVGLYGVISYGVSRRRGKSGCASLSERYRATSS